MARCKTNTPTDRIGSLAVSPLTVHVTDPAVVSVGVRSKFIVPCGSLFSRHENSIRLVMLQSSGLTIPA